MTKQKLLCELTALALSVVMMIILVPMTALADNYTLGENSETIAFLPIN